MSDNNNTPTSKYCENCKPEPGKIIHTKIDNTCRDCGRLLGGSLFKVPTPTPKEWKDRIEIHHQLSYIYRGNFENYEDKYEKADKILQQLLSKQKQELVEERKDEQYRIWGELFLLLQKDLEPKLLDKVRKIVFNHPKNK